MPLPKPRTKESESEFIGRCMSETKEEFPDRGQRSAVCHRQWEERENDSMKSWYEIRDAKHGIVEVLLYDEIGGWGITAADFVKDLQGIKANTINLRINSPGGDVFDGVAIYNALKRHGAEVHTIVDGLAASSASFISQAGDTILMAAGSTMMIHEPQGMTLGAAEDHTKMAETLDKMGDTIASFYASRAGGSEAEWRDRMRGESWYRAQEAVDIKLADGLVESASNGNRAGIFNLSRFKNVPNWVPQAAVVAAVNDPPEPAPSAFVEALREGTADVVRKSALPPYDFGLAVKVGTAGKGG